MNYFLFYLAFFIHIHSFGQSLELKLNKTCRSQLIGFGSLRTIDNRPKDQVLGIVQKGAFHKSAEVVFSGRLADSLGTFFADSTKQAVKAPLVLMLNEFFLNVVGEGTNELGRFRLSLRLFTGSSNDQYSELTTVDTVYTVSGGNVTKKVMNLVSEQFCVIAHEAYQNQFKRMYSDTSTYSFAQLVILDSLEKHKLPIYQVEVARTGIYKNYTQFKFNNPDTTQTVILEEGKNTIQVYIWDEDRKKKIKLPNKGLYAVSDGKTLVRATALGYFKMFKEGSDFYYWRPRPDNSGSAAVPAMGLLFGAVGGLAAGAIQAASPGHNKWLLQKINYRQGNSVPVSWVAGKPK